jgi:phosphoserine phosphatase RsbU/P
MAVDEPRIGPRAAIARSTMDTREALLSRRSRLERARTHMPDSTDLTWLLGEVDAALDRLDHGRYGICEVCDGAIEADHLAMNPLARTCLEDLTVREQRALEQDLDLARQVQHALLPKPQLSLKGWSTSYEYQPLSQAGGDYCDLIPDENGDLLFLLGDISGKGVAASVLMAHLHAVVRSLVSMRLPFPELVDRTNRIFCESTGGLHYATLVCGRANNEGDVVVCNAGHCPPLWIHNGDITNVPSTGLPIGLFCDAPTATTALKLAEGDTLLLYTDGVTEAVNSSDVEYGVDRLTGVASSHRRASAPELVTACAGDLAGFRGGAPRTDDVTILAVQRSNHN